MTRVAVLPADETACGYYRMRLPAGAVALERPDWRIDVYRPGDVKLGTGPDGALWGVEGLDLDGVDLVVMQRVATRAQVELISWMQKRGIAVVVDSDDAMWAIRPDNAAWKSWNSGPHHWRWLDAAAEIADLTTVTTDYLAQRYGKHGRTEVLPNCVPADVVDLPSIRESLDQTPTIGWAGFTGTHPRDLTVVGSAVAKVKEQTGCLVRVIGDAEGASGDWGCSVEKVNPTSLGQAYYTALTSLDVGLVPLLDHGFNKGKSYLKALEYAAMGVAVVASPTPANRELAKTLPILLADAPHQWHRILTEHVNHPDRLAYHRDSAREAVLQHHTYEGNAHRWVEVWERAMNRRARMSA